MKRGIKQLIYGLIYLLVIAIVIGGVYFFRFRPEPSCFDGRKNQQEEGVDCGGPCGVCLSANFRPIRVAGSPVALLVTESPSRSFTLIANIENPNPNLTARKFNYEFIVYSSDGAELARFDGSSFIYEGEIRPIVVPNVRINGTPFRTEFFINDAEWERAEDLPKPQFSLQSLSLDSRGGAIKVEGLLINRDTLNFDSVNIIALFYDARGNLAGASRSEVRDIPPSASRRFSVLHPFLPSIDTEATRVTVHVDPIR